MLSRTNAQLLKAALNTERSILDATCGRVMRAFLAHGEKNHAAEEYVRDAADHIAAASADIDELVEKLDTFIRS